MELEPIMRFEVKEDLLAKVYMKVANYRGEKGELICALDEMGKGGKV